MSIVFHLCLLLWDRLFFDLDFFDKRDDNSDDDPDTSLQFQIFYNYRISNNIDITSGFFVETKPEHDDRNDPIWVFVTRSTLRF